MQGKFYTVVLMATFHEILQVPISSDSILIFLGHNNKYDTPRLLSRPRQLKNIHIHSHTFAFFVSFSPQYGVAQEPLGNDNKLI